MYKLSRECIFESVCRLVSFTSPRCPVPVFLRWRTHEGLSGCCDLLLRVRVGVETASTQIVVVYQELFGTNGTRSTNTEITHQRAGDFAHARQASQFHRSLIEGIKTPLHVSKFTG